MAFIGYATSHLAPHQRVDDPDNIIQIHAVHPAAMRAHYVLYRSLMHDEGPVSRRLREMIAIRCSALNHCRY
jgi:alkylhydroperoxidase family enzyme